MCLAVLGRLVEVRPPAEGDVGRTGVVDFQGSRFAVSLAFTPGAELGDWILVHAGFAINRLDEAEAREIWDVLRDEEPPFGGARLDRVFPSDMTAADTDSA